MKLSVSTTVPDARDGIGLIDKNGVQYCGITLQAGSTHWYTLYSAGGSPGVVRKDPQPPVLLIRG